MQPALLDTSIYITALRTGNEALISLRRISSHSPLWLSAVVLEELYAGVNRQDRRVIDRLERDFERTQRILVPNLSDWTQTGQLLAQLAAEFDYEQIGQARGFAAGLAGHGIGTARAFHDSPLAGTFAGLALALNGLLTAVLAPLVMKLF